MGFTVDNSRRNAENLSYKGNKKEQFNRKKKLYLRKSKQQNDENVNLKIWDEKDKLKMIDNVRSKSRGEQLGFLIVAIILISLVMAGGYSLMVYLLSYL